jgi:hypothetical protein
VTSVQAAADVLAALLRNGKIQRATHNIMAYRIRSERDTFLQAWATPGPHMSRRAAHCACMWSEELAAFVGGSDHARTGLQTILH